MGIVCSLSDAARRLFSSEREEAGCNRTSDEVWGPKPQHSRDGLRRGFSRCCFPGTDRRYHLDFSKFSSVANYLENVGAPPDQHHEAHHHNYRPSHDHPPRRVFSPSRSSPEAISFTNMRRCEFTPVLLHKRPFSNHLQESCLSETPGVFDACPPGNLACLCALPQTEVERYVNIVAPCLDGDIGRSICTAGAIFREFFHPVLIWR